VVLVGVTEADNFFSVTVDVGLVVVTFFDWLGWSYQFSDVNGGRLSFVFQMISQVLEFVFEVVLKGDSVIKSLNFLLVGMNLGSLSLFLLGFGGKVAFVILFVFFNRLFGFKL
jgi:hypothetical protein